MDEMKYVLAIVSTFSILIPIVLSGWALFKKTEGYLWFFLLFLLVGFIVDVLSWYSYITAIQGKLFQIIRGLYEFYPIAEAIFFFWCIGFLSHQKKIKRASKFAMYLTIPAWIVIEVVLGSIASLGLAQLGLFHMLYRVIGAFLSSYALLILVEDSEQPVKEFRFWLLSGILFYSFTTFFVLLIRGTAIASQLWYLHNVMNIITYLIYSIGFYLAMKGFTDQKQSINQ